MPVVVVNPRVASSDKLCPFCPLVGDSPPKSFPSRPILAKHITRCHANWDSAAVHRNVVLRNNLVECRACKFVCLDARYMRDHKGKCKLTPRVGAPATTTVAPEGEAQRVVRVRGSRGNGRSGILRFLESPNSPGISADECFGFESSMACIDHLRAHYTHGLYRLFHMWVEPLRDVSTLLVQQMMTADQRFQWHSCAFFILPGLLRVLALVKNPRPLDLLRSCKERPENASTLIIRVAVEQLQYVDTLRAECVQKFSDQTLSADPARRRRRLRNRIERLFDEGRLGAATHTLEEGTDFLENETAIAPVRLTRAETVPILLSLNPVARPEDLLPAMNMEMAPADAIVFDVETLQHVLSKLPRGSSHGFSGWTFSSIRSLYGDRSESTTQQLGVIASFLSMLAAGTFANKHWVDSRAALLPKPGGGHRPLGIGEAWYRFLSKCLLAVVGESVGNSLAPIQLGCGVSGGAEIGARFAQTLFDLKSDKFVLIKTDFRNAFNSIWRKSIYEGLVKYCPRLLNWFRWAYGSSSILVDFDGNIVGSNESGCRQGDPLAPLLFCVGIHDTLESVQHFITSAHSQVVSSHPVSFSTATAAAPHRQTRSSTNRRRSALALEDDDISDVGSVASSADDLDRSSPPMSAAVALDPFRGLVMAYMDDCTFCVHQDITALVCNHLLTAFEGSLGLELNIGKCRAIGPATESIIPADSLPFAIQSLGDTILGVPVGTQTFREEQCGILVSRNARCLPTLAKLDIKAKTAFTLIKSCINPRMTYALRAIDILCGSDAAVAFDLLIDKALNRITQSEPLSTVEENLVQVIRCLPLHLGGLGVGRHDWIDGQLNCLRSRSLLRKFLEIHFPAMKRDAESGNFLQIGAGGLISLFPPATQTELFDETPGSSANLDEFGREPNAKAQYIRAGVEIADFISRNLRKPEDEDSEEDDEEGDRSDYSAKAAWFRSSQFSGSGRWLSDFKSSKHELLDADEFLVAFRQRLLLGPFGDLPAHTQPTQCTCGHIISPDEPHHFLDCDMEKPFFLSRHNAAERAVKDFLHKNVKELLLIQDQPPMHNLDGTPMGLFAGDLEVTGTTSGHNVLDITIVNPSAPTYRRLRPGSNHQADVANINKEISKRTKYTQTIEVLHGKFVPFSMEATGRLGPAAIAYIRKLIPEELTPRQVRLGRLSFKKDPIHALQARLSTVLTKFNARAIVHRRNLAWSRNLIPTERA